MKKFVSILLIALLALGVFAGCSTEAASSAASEAASSESSSAAEASSEAASSAAEKTKIEIAGLKGPTGFGMVKLMADAEAGTAANDYNFTIAGAPDEVTAKVIKGELDIAALPTNAAAVLYNKTKGNVQILALNTLGILYVVTKNADVQSLADLKGKTIYSTGKGAMPEYVLDYLLAQNGLQSGDVTVEYLSEHSELATKLLASEEPMIAVLPQPFVTQVTMKDASIQVAVDLTEEWNRVTGGSSVLSMGCIVVNKTFAEAHPDAVDAFCKEYEASIAYTNDQPAEAAQLIEKYGLLANAAMAEKAIPACHTTYIAGAELKEKLTGLFDVLYAANPASVGGALPDDAFYYSK